MTNIKKIVDEMMEKDAFSQWLGIEIIQADEEGVLLQMKVRQEMVNGFGISHGGISYSFADSALAFICNGEGNHAVSIETSISHLKKVQVGDILRAFAQRVNKTRKIGVYTVEISNQMNEIVAIFKGTVYISDKKW